MEGRQITIATEYDGIAFTDDVQVLTFKQLLPRDSEAGREKDLIQFYSDRGMRTVAVADLRPYQRRKRTQKVAADVDEDV